MSGQKLEKELLGLLHLQNEGLKKRLQLVRVCVSFCFAADCLSQVDLEKKIVNLSGTDQVE